MKCQVARSIRCILLLVALSGPLCGTGCRSFPNPYGLKRGPYLQQVTPTSVWVVWDTAGEEIGRVEFGASLALGQVASEDGPSRHHAIRLDNLSPYTEYYYRVGEIQAFAFRTAAAPSTGSFTFAVVGDTQTYHETHQAVVEQMIRKPDWYIHLGDMVEHGVRRPMGRLFRHRGSLDGHDPLHHHYRQPPTR